MKQVNLLMCFLLGGSMSAFAQKTPAVKTFTITVTNTWNKTKLNEPVVVQLNTSDTKFKICSAVVTSSDGTEIPSQLDDLNGDYRPDELAFVADIPAGSTKKFKVTLSSTPSTRRYEPRVYAHLRLNDKSKKFPFMQSVTALGSNQPKFTYNSIYGHGVCFESEKTACRLYFDNRQSIDLYGKKHYRLELAQTNFYTTVEQKKAGFGNDVLWAGQSVGLGSFRGVENDVPQYIDSVELRSTAILASGPVRTVVEMKDHNWLYKNKQVDMTQHYILYAGHRDVEAIIKLTGPAIQSELFCTGVQKLERDNVGFLKEDGLAGSWGTNLPEKGDTIANPRETVGLGIYVPASFINHSKEDVNNYLYMIRPDAAGSIKYHFTFCCTKEEEGFKDRPSWFNYLKEWETSLRHPCKIEIKPSK